MGAPSQDRQQDAQMMQVEQAQGEPLGQKNTSHHGQCSYDDWWVWQIRIMGPVDGNQDCEAKKKPCAQGIMAAFKNAKACDKAWEVHGHLRREREAANADLWRYLDDLLSKAESILARMERRGKRGGNAIKQQFKFFR